MVSSGPSGAVVQRYQDAYRVGNTIVGIGTTIKVIGFVLAALILLVSLLGGAAVGGQSGVADVASILTGGIAAGLIVWLAYSLAPKAKCYSPRSTMPSIIHRFLRTMSGRSRWPCLSRRLRRALVGLGRETPRPILPKWSLHHDQRSSLANGR
jgi:hypothetical protein